ncbi:MAG: DUF192 domain-containing protein [Planctomycetota bacterium]
MRALALLSFVMAACSGSGEASPYSDLQTATLRSGPAVFHVWLADTAATRAVGLMNATAADLAPLGDGTRRGMLFVFPVAQSVSFWMRDTEVPLDLAYLDETGRILSVHALVPLDETPVPSPGPIRYALEVRAGDLGVGVGDVIELP